ncbi:MAG: C45 family peptidase, partial [Paludibacteraceae bacterium]|nr:C45 family peptidase [Paludibacteraceae bacterium]
MTIIVGVVLLSAASLVLYVYSTADSIVAPNLETPPIFSEEIVQDSCIKKLGRNWIRKNADGLYDIYVEGNALERGTAFGKLSKDLLYLQESYFVDQLKVFVPSETHQKSLIKLINFFNRNITDYIPEENQTEIYGLSLSCSHEFDFVGNPFGRQLNFHAAHDIGHAMQDYMLVGCTSFAAWDSACADGNLVIGRNFDFFVGEEFAKNKLVSFFNPSDGYKFAMIGWAGMTGVLSGMNEKGLTVTINAAKSSMPTSTSMPISLLARQILQYASTIQEAYTIAKKAQTFVSESILIGSAIENRAAVIEKSTEKTVLFESGSNSLVCANHYQSDAFKNDEYNIENIKNSDSPYRQKRAEELIARLTPIDLSKATSILRDTRGLGDKNIGLGNEKALNQLIAHHSVVFMPK